jgi:hypothetical protein
MSSTTPAAGTPVTKDLPAEVQGLCMFLDYDPLHITTLWRELIGKPFALTQPAGLAAIRWAPTDAEAAP